MPLINYIGNRQECLDNKRGGRGNAPAPIFLDYLLVGGGQYGATNAGGGGGVVSGSIRFLPRFTLDVTVGNGGTGSIAKNAEPSIIQSAPNEFFVYAGPGIDFAVSGEPQSNPGGQPQDSIYSFGGAGGSSQIGQDTYDRGAHGGDGGSGSMWQVNGISYDNDFNQVYGGGGGGRGLFFLPTQGVGGVGGQGGGGNGASRNGAGGNGVDNLGGGGGGGFAACNGGSGIVKMRYISGSVMGATGGTISVSGSYVYHTFTSTGQFVYQP
jgi:hypothetical protein